MIFFSFFFVLLIRFLLYKSGGSGSEIGIQNKNSAKAESTQGSENNASMSDEDHKNENGSNGSMSNRDGGSDNGSGTQVICCCDN